MVRILVIDDEEIVRFTVREILEKAGHEVLEAENGAQGVDIQKNTPCKLIITDIIMPGKGGLSTIVDLKRSDANLKVIAISGGEQKDGHDYLGRADNLGADASLAKPFSEKELLGCVESSLVGRSVDADAPKGGYKRFLPKEFIDMLGVNDVMDVKLGDHIERKVTVLFSDIRSFTTISESMTPEENFEFINSYLSSVVPVIHEHGGLVDKFIGDAVMALFCETPDSAVRAALAMLRSLDDLNARNAEIGRASVRIGIGLNTGMVMMGAVGSKDRMETTVIGDSVNLSSRLESLTKVYGVSLLISEATLNALEDPLEFQTRFVDRVRVKGKLRAKSIYEVYDNDPNPLRRAKQDTIVAFENALAHYHLKDVEKAQVLFGQCLQAAPDDTVAKVYLERCENYFKTGEHLGTGEIKAEVAWSDAFLVDIPEVDAQHMELLNNINRLSRMIREDDMDKMTEVLDFLGSYTQNHFKTEEDLMRKYDYPFIREHEKEHRRFLEYYLGLREEIESQGHDKLYLLFKIDVFLVDWLVDHTTKVDMHMGRFLLRVGYKP